MKRLFYFIAIMKKQTFDEHADRYDAWFMENKNVLYSEVKMVAKALENSGEIYSVGCGSGLFEKILREEFDIDIREGLEPSTDMARIAKARGLAVDISTAEEATYGGKQYDTIIYNGCPCYMKGFDIALEKSYKALKPGGKIVVVDLPKESSYGLIYRLAAEVGSWDTEATRNISPKDPYPIELVKNAYWRSTPEKMEAMKKVGFTDFHCYQTLTTHPVYSNDQVEEPTEGYDKGDYVAICAYKK